MGHDNEEVKANTDANLKYLEDHSTIRMQQHIEWCECCCPCEKENEYTVQDATNKAILKLDEESAICFRWCCACCGSARPFTMDVRKPDGTKFLKFDRPWKIPCCCWRRQRIYVYDATTDEPIGYAGTGCSVFNRVLGCWDAEGNQVFEVIGHRCQLKCCWCCKEYEFEISRNGDKLGEISKYFSGAVRDTMSDSDLFKAVFPRDATPREKALLVAATVLIDYLYFENNKIEEVAESTTKPKAG